MRPRVSTATMIEAKLAGLTTSGGSLLRKMPPSNCGEPFATCLIAAAEAPSALGMPHAARANKPIPAAVAPNTVARSTVAASELAARAWWTKGTFSG